MLRRLWHSIAGRTGSPTSLRARRIPVRLILEPLDARNLLSTGVFQNALGNVVIEGTAGNDTVQVSVTGQEVTVDLNGTVSAFALASVQKLVFRGRDGNDNFMNDTTLTAQVFGGIGDDSVLGGSGRDLFWGGLGDDSCHGRGGDDSIVGGQGNDSLFGDDGRDSVFGEAGDDSVRGGLGNDDCRGGQGRDDILGEDGDDSIFGGSGDDFCGGGSGRDRISGGHGRDDSDHDSDDDFDDSEKGKPGNGDLPSVVTEVESNNEKSRADRFTLDANGSAQLLGTSSSHDDKDFFVFTAGQSGTLQVSVGTTNGVIAQIEVENAFGVDVFETEPNNGINSGSFAVTAGVTYFVRLRATDDFAAGYDVSLTLT